MEASDSILIQKHVRDNSEDLQNEYLDLKNWEEQMKKADAKIRNTGGDQILPPVRRKNKASKETSKLPDKKNAARSKRIKSYDYSAWEKFDVNKACEEVDRTDGLDDQSEEPMSKAELEKNHVGATEHKIMGNNFVKKEEWAKAVVCYSKAIKIFPYDAVFFANRAFCHMKMDNLYSAEADCTAAIQLDKFYIKAYHRRATIRISLRQYKEAEEDIKNILKLEPLNKEAKAMLIRVNKSIENSKPIIMSSVRDEVKQVDKNIATKLSSSDVNNKNMNFNKVEDISMKKKVIDETVENKVEKLEKQLKIKVTDEKVENKVEELEKQFENKIMPKLPEWLPEAQDNFNIVKFITKPPHQRSKKPLRTVPIEEIDFGSKIQIVKNSTNGKLENASDRKKEPSEVTKPVFIETDVPEAPKTAVQFLLTWRKNKSTEFRHKYLKKIPAESIPIIFQDSMESNTFSEILNVLRLEFTKHQEPVFNYLEHLSKVKRFRTLTMFMSKCDKEDFRALMDYSKTVEGYSDDMIKDLYVKYEI